MHDSEKFTHGLLRNVFGRASENKKALVIGLLSGAGVAIAQLAYFQYAAFHQIETSDLLWFLLLCLNPPSILGVIFIDVKPTNAQVAALYCVVVLLNAILYALVAKLVARVWKAYA